MSGTNDHTRAIDPDFADPEYVIGAVLAQLEDLPHGQRVAVLRAALEVTEGDTRAVDPWAHWCAVLAEATRTPWDFRPTGGGCWALGTDLTPNAIIGIVTSDGPMNYDDTPTTALMDDAMWSVDWCPDLDGDGYPSVYCADFAAVLAAVTDIGKHY